MAAIAAGGDSLMIEVHLNPAKALSDGPQSLTPQRFEELVQEMAIVGKVVGRWPQTFLLPTAQDAVHVRKLASIV